MGDSTLNDLFKSDAMKQAIKPKTATKTGKGAKTMATQKKTQGKTTAKKTTRTAKKRTVKKDAWRNDPASDNQTMAIYSWVGLDVRPCGLTKGQASDYISRIHEDIVSLRAELEELDGVIDRKPVSKKLVKEQETTTGASGLKQEIAFLRKEIAKLKKAG